MADDPTIRWTLASPYGIQVDAAQDAWYSGHVNDVLELDAGGLLVGTQTGGVWSIDTFGNTLPLSDSWDNPNILCLAFGPDDARHVFAGCTQGVIRETDVGQPAPLLSWTPVTNPLPAGAGDVRRIVILRTLRRIVVACDGGVFWSTIPASNTKRGCLSVFLPSPGPRQPYDWKQAKVEGGKPQAFWDLAVGATRSNQVREDLQDPRVITIVAGGYQGGGIFTGQWNSAGDLVMKKAKIHNDDGTDATGLFSIVGACSVSSCEVRPNVLYAGCSAKDGSFFRVLRSEDGGWSWGICGWTSTSPVDNLVALAGDQGAVWNNCIAVAPTNPALVALGWVELFLTLDSGKTWRQVQEETHLHTDRHALRFTPSTPGNVHNLYVGSDGGVARINMDDYLGLTGQPFQSNYNRLLPTLQCYSTPQQFYGTLGASKTQPGLIAAGLQDNGNVHCVLGAATTPWVDIDGGDGGWNAFIADGAMLHYTASGPTAATTMDNSGAVIVTSIIAVTDPPIPTGLGGPVGDPVIQPQYRNANRQMIQAVAGLNDQIFGLFVDEYDSPRYHWELVGTLRPGEIATAVCSYHGGSIFVGTAAGKMYVVDTKQRSFIELPVVVPKPGPTSKITFGAINRIVAFSESEAFATINNVVMKTVDFITGATTTVTAFYVLQLKTLQWVATPSIGLSNEMYFGLETVTIPNSGLQRALFVTTDDKVYVTRDDGATWQTAALGLPRNAHCRDLRFVSLQGRATLYLSTFGRSVWLAQLQ